jgi:hypothetical protein
MLDKQDYMHAHAQAPGYTYARTRTHKYVIAFPRQQWLRKDASVLRFTHISCLLIMQIMNRETRTNMNKRQVQPISK